MPRTPNAHQRACPARQPARGVLFAQGITDYDPRRSDRRERLEELRTGDGRPLPRYLKAMIERELGLIELLIEQIDEVRAERDALVAAERAATPQRAAAAMLLDLKGVGPGFAGVLWSEGLFRRFDNRRQLAAYAGLARTPWQSGSIDHEQGWFCSRTVQAPAEAEALAQPQHGFEALDGPPRRVEGPEAADPRHVLLHPEVVALDALLQVLGHVVDRRAGQQARLAARAIAGG